ncbi:UDP-N-acetylmuramoyl-L-alanyl-D-glutamate--2,6-diaminopimelate ligase [Idiomarina sp. X4]|uniref:UDP-N-acetylmuramoyl-L-alanyl-D-glutamate--2, 6-diaminopimelate ligase n=1 Tax=Idiomarina sp. X4 TaxID=2055892 RepID=UPI000C28853A|nr:UDP-N-acetylmuramoyl-L-alanyl-D-glutamate--2,6-diaminopimelate ligase [Idiomarina sp. X4]ATZ72822.1 UDP-N-acetylmuramoyl-L-alanyl-D-glutamate--2,6-diaminopimelate ligase [Idiomarina sp. X4]
MKALSELLTMLPASLNIPEVTVSGVKLDSRQVANGDLFIAVPGYETDGRAYIDAAIDQGAVAVVAESPGLAVEQRRGAVVVGFSGVREHLSEIAGNFFDHPSKGMTVVGVTGTNGKTSVTHIIAQLAQRVGRESAVIGTTGSGLIGRLLPERHTTPDAVTIQQRLATLKAEGAELVAMEVSSHALVQRRVDALKFAAAAITNISRDHLDYHGTMDNYIAAKQRLFTDFGVQHRIVNADDAVLTRWHKDNGAELWVTLNPSSLAPSLTASGLQFHEQGSTFNISWQGLSYNVETPLLGRFNVYNVLTAVATLLSLGYELSELAGACKQLMPVPGRMEAFHNQHSPLVVVDYAHTPDALDQVLKALRLHCKGQLWCVFGCGGDRDRGKRPQMGKVAADSADVVVVTDDNPRTEPSEQIIDDILAGIAEKDKVKVWPGRREAVLKAMQEAKPDDVVLLAGKGHEDYQVIGTQRIDYNERAVVSEWLQGDCA